MQRTKEGSSFCVCALACNLLVSVSFGAHWTECYLFLFVFCFSIHLVENWLNGEQMHLNKYLIFAFAISSPLTTEYFPSPIWLFFFKMKYTGYNSHFIVCYACFKCVNRKYIWMLERVRERVQSKRKMINERRERERYKFILKCSTDSNICK